MGEIKLVEPYYGETVQLGPGRYRVTYFHPKNFYDPEYLFVSEPPPGPVKKLLDEALEFARVNGWPDGEY